MVIIFVRSAKGNIKINLCYYTVVFDLLLMVWHLTMYRAKVQLNSSRIFTFILTAVFLSVFTDQAFVGRRR